MQDPIYIYRDPSCVNKQVHGLPVHLLHVTNVVPVITHLKIPCAAEQCVASAGRAAAPAACKPQPTSNAVSDCRACISQLQCLPVPSPPPQKDITGFVNGVHEALGLAVRPSLFFILSFEHTCTVRSIQGSMPLCHSLHD